MDIPVIKKQLVKHLSGGEAFMPVDQLLKEVEYDKLGERPTGLPYSFFEIFYHMHFAQKDILDYCRGGVYIPHEWPKDYWPDRQAPSNINEWEKLKVEFLKDREQLKELLLAPEIDLTKEVKEGTGHTLLRGALLCIEHNAYHTGQLMILMRKMSVRKR